MAKVPFGHAARATRAVSSGMVPSSWGYIDIALLLTHTFFGDFYLLLYHSSISCIRHQSLTRVGFLKRAGRQRLSSHLAGSFPKKPTRVRPPPLLQSCQIACFSNEFVVDILHLVGDVLPAELQDRSTRLRAHLGQKVGVFHERIESLTKKSGTAWNQVAGL